MVVFVNNLKMLLPFKNKIENIVKKLRNTRLIFICRENSFDPPRLSAQTVKDATNFKQFKKIQLPTLIDQINNIDSIAEQLLRSLGKGKHFADEAIFLAFRNYGWKENFSELKKVILQICENAQGDCHLTAKHLPEEFRELLSEKYSDGKILDINKKIFFIYSKIDCNFKNKLLDHLSPFHGDIITWNDDDVLPGEEWDDKIKKELFRADIVIYLVSVNSITTKYINEEELPIIEKRCKLKQCILVPIIVNYCSWEKLWFATYAALPRKGLEITNNHWQNEDQAWKHVVTELATIIKQ